MNGGRAWRGQVQLATSLRISSRSRWPSRHSSLAGTTDGQTDSILARAGIGRTCSPASASWSPSWVFPHSARTLTAMVFERMSREDGIDIARSRRKSSRCVWSGARPRWCVPATCRAGRLAIPQNVTQELPPRCLNRTAVGPAPSRTRSGDRERRRRGSKRSGISMKSVVCEIQITPPLPLCRKTT